MRLDPQEQGHQRIGEQTAKALESREERETVGVGQLSSHERVQRRAVEAPMPQKPERNRRGHGGPTRTSATASMPPEISDVKKTFWAHLVSWCVIVVTRTLSGEAFPKAELSANIAGLMEAKIETTSVLAKTN